MKNINNVYIFIGATASGKTSLSVELAKKVNGYIINGDSVQIYKEIPIISAQPTMEEQKGITHKLFGMLSLAEKFSSGSWVNLAIKEIETALSLKKIPIIVGGSGLYLSSLVYGLSPIPSSIEHKNEAIKLFDEIGYDKFFEEVKKFDPIFTEKFQDKQRLIRAFEVYLLTKKPMSELQKLPRQTFPAYKFNVFHVFKDRSILYDHINQRFLNMVNNGAIEEAENILKSNIDKLNIKKATGLFELTSYLKNLISLDEAISTAQQNTRNLAKRQLTWFRNQFSTAQMLVKPEAENIKDILCNTNL